MGKYESYSITALENKLVELRDLLDEVQEERIIILGQENLHLSSKLVVKYENEIKDIKEDIETVEKLLVTMK